MSYVASSQRGADILLTLHRPCRAFPCNARAKKRIPAQGRYFGTYNTRDMKYLSGFFFSDAVALSLKPPKDIHKPKSSNNRISSLVKILSNSQNQVRLRHEQRHCSRQLWHCELWVAMATAWHFAYQPTRRLGESFTLVAAYPKYRTQLHVLNVPRCMAYCCQGDRGSP